MTGEACRIVPYHPDYAEAFDRLNRAWLEAWFTVEPLDEIYLRDPEGTVVRPGGEIFFALEGNRVLGTCAAIPQAEGSFELAKLAVDPAAQGRGLGRRLAETVIAFAASRSATRLFLLSSTRLLPALRLYQSLGFQHRPFPGPPAYVDADVYMELVPMPGPAASPLSTSRA
jgi:putative acetyltransferase